MEWDADAIMRIAIGVFFILFGVGVAYALFRLAAVLRRLSNILAEANTQVSPLLTRIESTLDGVNSELAKVEEITESVAVIAATAEQTTTAVYKAVAKPIKRLAGAYAGITEGVMSLLGTRRKEL